MHSTRYPHSSRPHLLRQFLLAALVAFAVACGSSPEPQPQAATAQTDHAGHEAGTPRVYFIQPEDGATVTSPVQFVFGIEHFELAPVPPDPVTEVRHGVGHHHLGVNTECLPPGVVIPQASPWIHFGDAKTEIDMQMPPGQHTFALQLGDDEHRTIEGLCATITINVVEK